jgi:hypothetical protein
MQQVMIKNTSKIPQVPASFHVLEVEDVELVESKSFDDPTTLEERLKIQLRVRTPGVDDESFYAFMAPKTSPKATFGKLLRACLGNVPADDMIDAAAIVGQRFAAMTGHTENGWPRLIPDSITSAGDAPF